MTACAEKEGPSILEILAGMERMAASDLFLGEGRVPAVRRHGVVRPLDLPPTSYETMALWFDIPPRIVEEVRRRRLDLHGGLHAAEHAAIAVLPLFAMCDRWDIGGLSTPALRQAQDTAHVDTGRPQIFIYDAFPGGVGIAEKGFELLTELWRTTLRAVEECPCEAGCPSCIQSPKCGNNNEPLDKEAAVVILKGLLRK